MKQLIQILFCLFLFSSCAFVASKITNIQDIKSATGVYPVGTKRMVWIDSTRTNWFIDGYGKYRKLMAQIWYPADN